MKATHEAEFHQDSSRQAPLWRIAQRTDSYRLLRIARECEPGRHARRH